MGCIVFVIWVFFRTFNFWGNALLETNWRLDSAQVPQHKGSTLHLGVSGSADFTQLDLIFVPA